MGCISHKQKPQLPKGLSSQQQLPNYDSKSIIVYNPVLNKLQSIPVLVPANQSGLQTRRRIQSSQSTKTPNNIL